MDLAPECLILVVDMEFLDTCQVIRADDLRRLLLKAARGENGAEPEGSLPGG